jgi:hypothetical protein
VMAMVIIASCELAVIIFNHNHFVV